MIIVGICDESRKDREHVKMLCERCFSQNRGIVYQFIEFPSGEKLLEYFNQSEWKRISVLFLAVEIGEMNGFEVRDELNRGDFVQRIVFVTSHGEMMQMAFGEKVVGFSEKPVQYEQVEGWMEMIRRESEENVAVNYTKAIDNLIKKVEIEQIKYIKAERDYTRIFLQNVKDGILCKETMKQWKLILKDLPFLFVHRSYIVNMQNIKSFSKIIRFDGDDVEIPVGRTCLNRVRGIYLEYQRSRERKEDGH